MILLVRVRAFIAMRGANEFFHRGWVYFGLLFIFEILMKILILLLLLTSCALCKYEYPDFGKGEDTTHLGICIYNW